HVTGVQTCALPILACSVTLSASTPRCSTTIFLTRSAVSLILSTLDFTNVWSSLAAGFQLIKLKRWPYQRLSGPFPRLFSSLPAPSPVSPRNGCGIARRLLPAKLASDAIWRLSARGQPANRVKSWPSRHSHAGSAPSHRPPRRKPDRRPRRPPPHP